MDSDRSEGSGCPWECSGRLQLIPAFGVSEPVEPEASGLRGERQT